MEKINFWQNNNSSTDSNSPVIIYIHGGGYVMGTSDDLPQSFFDYFLLNNYRIIGINYGLAPQLNFSEIIDEIEVIINDSIIDFSIEEYYLFGRSSGGNAILNINPKRLIKKPKSLILFYSYSSDDLTWMNSPIRNQQGNINTDIVNSIHSSKNISRRRETFKYYPYYYYLRKENLWINEVKFKKRNIKWNNEIPCFLIHSIFDPDVPFKCTLRIKNHFINCQYIFFKDEKHAIDHIPQNLDLIIKKLDLFLKTN